MKYDFNLLIFGVVMVWFNLRIHTDSDFNPELCVENKRVLVTGTSSGIGEQLAYRYAELGAKLLITGSKNSLIKVAEKCRKLGAKMVEFVAVDMAVADDRTKLAESVEKMLQGLDIIILNHDVIKYDAWNSTWKSVVNLKEMMDVNFVSYVDITSKLMPLLMASGRGSIGVVAPKDCATGLAEYCATKHAVRAFYSSLGREMNLGLSVTFAAFGPMDFVGNGTEGQKMKGKERDAARLFVRGISNRENEVEFTMFNKMLMFVANQF